MDPRTRLFESHRRALEGLAYRMLGTRADALDVVQETFLRWNQADIGQIREPRAWLITACSRLAINMLRSARARRELYVGTWLPEPFVGDGDDAQIDETVSVALMLALERLTPSERAAFLLHDAFGYGFDEIADMLGKHSAACRKLASRARTRVREARPKFAASAAEHQRLISAFVQAARAGELDALRGLLAEDVELYADGGGKAQAVAGVLRGLDVVSRFLVGVWAGLLRTTQRHSVALRWFNGCPGVLIHEDDRLATALVVSIDAGKIWRVYGHRNPDKLVALQ
jgi:RNA polymerase sigma-70 factor (ECF subfamily)